MDRRILLAGVGMALATPHLARAQTGYPERPIRLIVPFPPGGGTDMISREIGTRVAAATGWTVVVDNRPGAGGNIGLDAVAKAAPDGHTIGMGQTANLAINPALYRNMPYDVLRDFTPIGLVAQQPNIIVVGKHSPVQSLSDLLAAARAQPGHLSAGHPGNGTVGHLSGEVLNRLAGVQITQVPYRGAGTVVTDLLAGRLDVYSANPLSVKGVLQAGEVRAIAVTSAARTRAFPEVPTVAEQGFPGFEAMNWTGLVAPARLPEPILTRWNEEMRKAVSGPEIVSRLATEGSEPVGSTPAEFRAKLEAELTKWGQVVREGKLALD
ncbi:Bug family tripartite tricarboxylate transporter substrate binding protein [Roseomonas xinghualingensis]|uniref:Bug family tripartite tricarboxylate transporter substrate binding protein n=1 Tax=Roseomonas xinghualingensis TaxID=2986475 RepID=UPI0021F180A9|nr:tripartite tricarboxylate transporter substrate binding protein [Roseomonas sp. SXEYE001]MCV4209225.1 tripartite tricarboxylate transporter substrate binding protein [Roseomonas sp. SXEYE001]